MNYTINATGSFLVKTGGGCLLGPVTVQTAGSADCSAVLYDGTSSSGTPVATVALNAVGPQPTANYAFTKGLFAVVSGSTAPAAQISFN